jgi:hypothetical protein
MSDRRCVWCENHKDKSEFTSLEAADLCNGEMVCDDCAEAVVEANSQFGVGA